MLAGPLFTRQLATAPRRARLYVARSVYAAALAVLLGTGWLVVASARPNLTLGETARFGAIVFEILAPLQLALALFFSALFTASSVAREKDRRTLILLLATRLSNAELVLGKLAAGLLHLLAMLLAGAPIFMLLTLVGGVSFSQIARVYGVTLAAIVVGGSFGATIAFWREKTFQTLGLTTLALLFWLAAGEAIASLDMAVDSGATLLGWTLTDWATIVSPRRALALAAEPIWNARNSAIVSTTFAAHFACSALVAAMLNGAAIVRLRRWNPSREARRLTRRPEAAEAKRIAAKPASSRPAGHRPVWDNPILWREMATWAHGRKVLLVRAAYVLLALLSIQAIVRIDDLADQWTRIAALAPLAPLAAASLMLINATAVTSIVGERDGGCLDLLLVADLTPKEIVFGKLFGSLYNAKEMIALPAAVCVYLWFAGGVSLENLFYLLGGYAVLVLFAAMLGLHCGMIHADSRTAIGVSLGTLAFLLAGVAVCIALLTAFSDPLGRSFRVQLAPFLAMMVGGSAGMYLALGQRTGSSAILWASVACPLATFWAITSYFLNFSLGIFLVTLASYGFATAAMMIPAISEFDAIAGRSSGGKG